MTRPSRRAFSSTNPSALTGQRYRATFSGDEREAGVYFYRLTHNGKTMTQTGTLAR